MNYRINRTNEYHIHDLNTLGWELTVCNSLEPHNSPIRPILRLNDTYGNLLIKFLSQYIPFHSFHSIVEIGGGYGFIMRDLLVKYSGLHAVMVDISQFLLKKQEELLQSNNVKFINADFFSLDSSYISTFECAILNENAGDFPTIIDVTLNSIQCLDQIEDPVVKRMLYFIEKYDLSMPPSETVINFNIGACEAVEKLCLAGIPFVFIGEHSCEAEVPDIFKNKISFSHAGIPEPISLAGHKEYTIKFSYLQKIAEKNNYTVKRGSFIDFIQINYSDKINFILTSNSQKDEHEIIRQFIEDIIKYEYLVLIKRMR